MHQDEARHYTTDTKTSHITQAPCRGVMRPAIEHDGPLVSSAYSSYVPGPGTVSAIVQIQKQFQTKGDGKTMTIEKLGCFLYTDHRKLKTLP